MVSRSTNILKIDTVINHLKEICLILFLIAVVWSLTACGNSGSGGSTTDAADETLLAEEASEQEIIELSKEDALAIDQQVVKSVILSRDSTMLLYDTIEFYTEPSTTKEQAIEVAESIRDNNQLAHDKLYELMNESGYYDDYIFKVYGFTLLGYEAANNFIISVSNSDKEVFNKMVEQLKEFEASVALIQEARINFLTEFGYSESEIDEIISNES